MFQDITIEELMESGSETHTLVDVRSPKEYEEATIPGSINIPIFTNEERAVVGTIYTKIGKEAAKEKGLEILSAKLPQFIAAFKQMDTPITVFCWRGGMRSKTTATLLDLMGIKVNRLKGGFRSHRKWIVQFLKTKKIVPPVIVLNGTTGVGKTTILHHLAQTGQAVIDLEGMAGHRGSIFGGIGKNPANQRKFEALLVEALRHYQSVPAIFTEGESRKIGKVSIPDMFYRKKENGIQLVIDMPIQARVQNILSDYKPWTRPQEFKEAFQLIKRRIHTPVAKQIAEYLQKENYEGAVQLLLEYYYDPYYKNTAKKFSDNKIIRMQATSVDEAVEKIQQMIQSGLLFSLALSN